MVLVTVNKQQFNVYQHLYRDDELGKELSNFTGYPAALA